MEQDRKILDVAVVRVVPAAIAGGAFLCQAPLHCRGRRVDVQIVDVRLDAMQCDLADCGREILGGVLFVGLQVAIEVVSGLAFVVRARPARGFVHEVFDGFVSMLENGFVCRGGHVRHPVVSRRRARASGACCRFSD